MSAMRYPALEKTRLQNQMVKKLLSLGSKGATAANVPYADAPPVPSSRQSQVGRSVGRSVGHRTSHRHRGDADAPVPLPTPATTKIGRDDIAVICYLRRFAEMCLRADAVRFSTVSTGWLLYRAAQARAARRYIRRDVASSRHAPRAPSPHWKVLSEPCELRPRADGPSRATDYQRGRLMF